MIPLIGLAAGWSLSSLSWALGLAAVLYALALWLLRDALALGVFLGALRRRRSGRARRIPA